MKRTYKASVKSYMGFGLFALFYSAFILGLLSIEKPPHELHHVMPGIVISIALPTFVFWWLSRFRLTIGPESISYSSAFSREQSVDLADIRGAKVVLIYESRRRPLHPTRLYLAIKNGDKIMMRIQHIVFSREAYQDLNRVVMPSDVAPQQCGEPQKTTALYQKRWVWYILVGFLVLLCAGLLEWFY